MSEIGFAISLGSIMAGAWVSMEVPWVTTAVLWVISVFTRLKVVYRSDPTPPQNHERGQVQE